MHLSTLLLTLGLAATASAQDSLLEEYRGYLRQAHILNPGPANDTFDFRMATHFREHEVKWGLPPNMTAPNMTRFENISHFSRFFVMYDYLIDGDDIPEDDGINTVAAPCGQSGGGSGMTTFGGNWPGMLFEDIDEPGSNICVERIVEKMKDRAGWSEVGDLRGGKRFWFRLNVAPYFSDDVADDEMPDFVSIDSSKFDMAGVQGYTTGQEGTEWSSSDRVRGPMVLVGVVAAAAVAWIL